jgi:hypothetical protein
VAKTGVGSVMPKPAIRSGQTNALFFFAFILYILKKRFRTANTTSNNQNALNYIKQTN